jgi:RNA polymerase sigma-70 factor (ECF subfamily)
MKPYKDYNYTYIGIFFLPDRQIIPIYTLKIFNRFKLYSPEIGVSRVQGSKPRMSEQLPGVGWGNGVMSSASLSLEMPSASGALSRYSASSSSPMSPPASDAPASDHDDALLVRIGDGDQDAYRMLVERHIDRAFAVALRILNNRADAEDVVQDTFLKVWTHRGRWEGGKARFSTWLYRVVTNRCIDLRRQPRSEEIENVPEPQDERPDALASMQRHAVNRMLDDAMRKLPDQQRIALIFSYHENLSNSEIAEVMETTVAAVESLLKRGRQQLRKLLRRSEGDIRQTFTDE